MIGKATTGDDPNLHLGWQGPIRPARERRRQLRHCSSRAPPNPPVHKGLAFSVAHLLFFFASNRASNVGNLAQRKISLKSCFVLSLYFFNLPKLKYLPFHPSLSLSTPKKREKEGQTRCRKKASNPYEPNPPAVLASKSIYPPI